MYFPISQLQWGKSALSPADNRDDLTGGVQGAGSPRCTLHRCAVPGGTWVTRTWVTRAAERPAPGDPRLCRKLTVLSHLTSQHTPRPRGRGVSRTHKMNGHRQHLRDKRLCARQHPGGAEEAGVLVPSCGGQTAWRLVRVPTLCAGAGPTPEHDPRGPSCASPAWTHAHPHAGLSSKPHAS